MASPGNELFYTRLPVNEISLVELLGEDHLFYEIPADWHVVIADIKNSSQAISKGLHETVNLIATGCIVAVLNIAYRNNMTVPFFFGGDGAAFILPFSITSASIGALLAHRDNARNNFDIILRVGSVPVNEIYGKGFELKISKLRTSTLFAIPVLLGDGLSFAERRIKEEDYQPDFIIQKPDTPDLSGMQCRWDKIKPPHDHDEVLSLLVVAGPGLRQSEAFQAVIGTLDKIYGGLENRRPISVAMLRLKGTVEKIGLEMRAKFGRFKPFYLFINLVKMSLGHLYFRTGRGKRYLQHLVALSDTLVIDGRINTVISGTPEQHKRLQEALSGLEAGGLIRYGCHVSKESVMSCYVRNLNEDHVHFVDGADGGYTRAAEMLKKKLIQIM